MEMARSERFELPTLGIEIRCSIQLSYERVPLSISEWDGHGKANSPSARAYRPGGCPTCRLNAVLKALAEP